MFYSFSLFIQNIYTMKINIVIKILIAIKAL